jgi:hypothetical protein
LDFQKLVIKQLPKVVYVSNSLTQSLQHLNILCMPILLWLWPECQQKLINFAVDYIAALLRLDGFRDESQMPNVCESEELALLL